MNESYASMNVPYMLLYYTLMCLEYNCTKIMHSHSFAYFEYREFSSLRVVYMECMDGF